MRTISCLAAAVLFSIGTLTSAQGVKPNVHKGKHPVTPVAGAAVPGAPVPPPAPAEPPKPAAVGTTSQLQIVYPPSDVVTNGVDNLEATLAMRALKEGLGEPKIVAGTLRDEGASTELPTEVFHLERNDPIERKDLKSSHISTTRLTRFSIFLEKSLWVGATEDSGAQAVPFKVFVRPTSSWFVGALLIAAGAGLSWFALFWVSRQRQLAANQVLIVRLGRVVANLSETLQSYAQSRAPTPTQSLAHLDQIRKDRLPELLHDKELSVLAGVVVPTTSSVNVVDEVEGMNRIVQHGFVELLQLWNAPGANQPLLKASFQKNG